MEAHEDWDNDRANIFLRRINVYNKIVGWENIETVYGQFDWLGRAVDRFRAVTGRELDAHDLFEKLDGPHGYAIWCALKARGGASD